MKTLIEKQAAAAVARQNSPSRLEAFATNSPPRQRRTTKSTPSGRTAAAFDRSGSGGAATQLRHGNPGGSIPLADLVSATTSPRSRGVVRTRIGGGFNTGVDIDGSDRESARRSLARETYTKTFSGMQVRFAIGATGKELCCFLLVESVPTNSEAIRTLEREMRQPGGNVGRRGTGYIYVIRTCVCL